MMTARMSDKDTREDINKVLIESHNGTKNYRFSDYSMRIMQDLSQLRI